MKKIFIILLLFISFTLVSCDEEFVPLDKIHEYTIKVDPNKDGTLNINYYIKWEVLEEGDGGVDFITVGVANRFVENIKGLTNNIKKIHYSSENGSTVQIDFKNTYHKGDIFTVSFSIRQKRIFTLNNNQVEYSFKPGWFEEIQVEKLTLYWNKDGVVKTNATEESGNYYKWTESLDYNETIKTNLVYDKSYFETLNPKEDYSDQTENPVVYIIFIGILAAFIVFIIVINNITADKYQSCRGFSGHIHHHHFYFGRHQGYRRSGKVIVKPSGTSGSGVHGSGCACACACACAGGGRAGCSRKDFNNYLNV